MRPLDLIRLTPLTERTSGRPDVSIGLIDGPVIVNHPELAGARIQEIRGEGSGACNSAGNGAGACSHGTFVAGILSAKRGTDAPAICPDCTLQLRPIFAETTAANGQTPSATPQELAAAIVDCVEAGARIINLSLALDQPSTNGESELEQALDMAAQRGVIVVAAAGNQGTLGSTAILRHPWVIPVAAYDLDGRPISQSNLGSSIGRRGLGAPGDNVISLGVPNDKPPTMAGTSVAAPFVTGSIALLWTEFPRATAAEVKYAVTKAYSPKRPTVTPPLLDAWTAYQFMTATQARR